MNEKEEIILMLKVLKQQAVSGTEVDGYEPIFKSTIIADVSYDSFVFVINKAIDYIKEH